MAWSASSVFREWNKAINGSAGLPTTYAGLSADTVNAALFNNTTTPDKDAAGSATGFNTGVWTTTNEVTDATNWVSGGRPLASKTFNTTAGGIFAFSAANTAGGGNVTITNAFGCMVYDNTITGTNPVAKQGICFNYFGGAQSVTSGTFTITWNASGIARWTSS
jgi:hypothetical protein